MEFLIRLAERVAHSSCFRATAEIKNNCNAFNVECHAEENLCEIVLQSVNHFMQAPHKSRLNIEIKFQASPNDPSTMIPTAEVQTVQDETLEKYLKTLTSEDTFLVMNPFKPEIHKTVSRTRCPKCREEQNLKK